MIAKRSLQAMALGGMLLFASAASAITIHDLTIEIVDGPFAGDIGTGTFSYDEAELVDGDEVFDPVFGSLTLEIELLGQMFTEADDVDFMDFPQVEFVDFEPVFLNLVISEDGFNPVDIDAPGISFISAIGDLIPEPGGGFLVFASTVPEPSTGLLCLLGLLFAAPGRCARRR